MFESYREGETMNGANFKAKILELAETGEKIFNKSGVVLIGTCLATQCLESYFFGIRPIDLQISVSASTFLLATTVISFYIPAGRATKVDTVIALRYA